jgi:hypothetical protein
MVDRQTPTVESDEELSRDAKAQRKTSEAPLIPPTPGPESGGDRAGMARPAPESAKAASSPAGDDAELFERDATRDYKDRWIVIQTQFVDEPRKAVEGAEALVGEVMQTLSESFARERRDLEARWSGDRDVSTEDLRQAIRRYRSFFNRLLSL